MVNKFEVTDVLHWLIAFSIEKIFFLQTQINVGSPKQIAQQKREFSHFILQHKHFRTSADVLSPSGLLFLDRYFFFNSMNRHIIHHEFLM